MSFLFPSGMMVWLGHGIHGRHLGTLQTNIRAQPTTLGCDGKKI
jgi:hypothetical protein